LYSFSKTIFVSTKGKELIKNLKLFDLSGKLILDKKTNHLSFLIEDVSFIKNGIYLVVLNNKYSQKISLN